MYRVLVVALVAGCVVVSSPDDGKPSRMIGTITTHVGYASVDEESPDGPTGPGPAFGMHGGVMYRVNPKWAIGLGVDFAISAHDTMIERRSASFWTFMLPVVATRYELGRFAVSSWGGYYMGFRSISEPGGSFGTRTFSSEKTHGGSLAVAGVVRLRISDGPSLEFGPYVQGQYMVSKEDDTRTSDFDEDGLRMRSIAVGLVLQGAFGAPPIAGDQF